MRYTPAQAISTMVTPTIITNLWSSDPSSVDTRATITMSVTETIIAA